MPRLENDSIKETVPETELVGFLQVNGYRCTTERDTVAKVLDQSWKALTVLELKEETKLSRSTLYGVLKAFREEKLVHFSPSSNAYFACRRLMHARRRIACHSFGICKTCKAVKEKVEEGHVHPKFANFQVQTQEHEWLGLCRTCKLKP